MSTYDKIWWLPITGGLTGVGVVLSYLAMRRRGWRAGVRGAAWSLLPLAAYLTGSIEMFWKMGVAIGDFAKGFAFSARVWSGIAVAGAAVVLFAASGGARRRRARRQAVTRPSPGGAVAAGTAPAAIAPKPTPMKPAKRSAAAAADDDMKDIEEILRRRGIS